MVISGRTCLRSCSCTAESQQLPAWSEKTRVRLSLTLKSQVPSAVLVMPLASGGGSPGMRERDSSLWGGSGGEASWSSVGVGASAFARDTLHAPKLQALLWAEPATHGTLCGAAGCAQSTSLGSQGCRGLLNARCCSEFACAAVQVQALAFALPFYSPKAHLMTIACRCVNMISCSPSTTQSHARSLPSQTLPAGGHVSVPHTQLGQGAILVLVRLLSWRRC